jgi:hypothetical protein
MLVQTGRRGAFWLPAKLRNLPSSLAANVNAVHVKYGWKKVCLCGDGVAMPGDETPCR